MGANLKSPPRLLIGERDPFMRDLLQRVLAEQFEVEYAASGPVVLEKAKSFQPDLIILEILLPELDGFQVCQQLKDNPQTAHIPVLFFSMLLAEHRATQVGGDAFLIKPLRKEQFLKEIEKLLKKN
ncbi:response regulator [candidate division KSB1 bacterium]|nr:MAG: hypothetical protein B5M50_00890 [candidate division KSB1 bacterium 4484_219]RKY77903.1 MAG: response regulator [candidate division KSB1 bacterium]RKY79858.1 MAG: response regulator [candidate division KSB1 bacterium]RKY85830.1 MAG: response regulator [candidate division KSB1 bacterium]RKY88715.1 MAG: response regulator [candidate division KSB1 bacterium]